MDLQEQLEIGNQAEAFLKYTEGNPYFKGLLERIKLEMASQILRLRPEDKDAFAEIKSEMNGVDTVMNAVRGDIFLGSEALMRLEGKTESKGIL
jgi:hypothetical protein